MESGQNFERLPELHALACGLKVQWLYYESIIIGVFWDFLWHKSFVCIICEIYVALEYAHKPPWPTGFEKSKIHQPNLEKLQF